MLKGWNVRTSAWSVGLGSPLISLLTPAQPDSPTPTMRNTPIIEQRISAAVLRMNFGFGLRVAVLEFFAIQKTHPVHFRPSPWVDRLAALATGKNDGNFSAQSETGSGASASHPASCFPASTRPTQGRSE